VSSLVDRLRGVVRPVPKQARFGTDDEGAQSSDFGADVLEGQWHERSGRHYLVVDRTYAPGHRHGSVSVADSMPSADGAWPQLRLLTLSKTKPRNGTCTDEAAIQRSGPAAGRADSRGTRALFLDVETTGLAGGAGTYAFLVGCGWFEGALFRVRQLFLSSSVAERALLEAFSDLVATAGTIVTYNGKTFDVPLLETRFLMHRIETPFGGPSHVDMLHSARHLWRADDEDAAGGSAGCGLTALEHLLFGHVREADVEGFEIPSRYFHYVRTGDARPLYSVLEHNRLDLLALALMTARAAHLLETGPSATRTPREVFGLGQLYERAGMSAEALACYARAAGLDDAPLPPACAADGRVTRAQALHAYAVLCRRDRAYEAAAEAWRRVLEMRGCPPRLVREAAAALAVHHEHRRRDPHAARGFALRSLALEATVVRRQAVQHRLARLDRKLAQSPHFPAPLF
jgi:uncharacterized protein YprB with RNaseH-like and TPR domain